MAISKFSSKIRLPVMRYSVNISYSEVEKPSGIAYMILMMVKSAGLTKFSWADQMAEFELPTIMFGIFRDEMEIMKQNGMIEYSDGISLKTPVNQVTMTENGKKVFEQGIITSHTRTRIETILHYPADGQNGFRIQTAKNQNSVIDGIDPRYDSIEFDEGAVDNYISEEKRKFFIKASETIFGIEHLSKSKCSYTANVNVSFNEVLGNFTIMGNRRIDERFIKKYFTSPEIICALDSDPFNLPLELSGYNPRKTTNWQNYSCILPVSLDLHNEKYIIYPISNPVIEGGYMVNTLIDDGDFAIISSKSIGSVYQYVEKDISVNGMEGSIVKPVFIRKPLSVDDIELIMTSIAETQYDGSIIGLDKAITILDRVNYVSGIESFVKKYLKVTHDARGLNELSKKYRKSQWVRNIRSLLVEVLSELPHESRLALCKSISSANLTINGQQAGFAMRSTDNKENVELADHLLKISSPLTRDELLVNLNIADIVAEYIQDGQSLEQPVSEVFKNMNYASISLKMLKEFTGGDLSDYFYSYEKILPENKGKIIKYAQDLSINLGLLHEVVPSDSLDDLIDLAKVYSDIALTVDDSQEIDYRKVNGRLFGINMRIRVEDDLKRLLNDTFSSLETLIINSSKIYIDDRNRIKLIDSTQVKVLHDIRHFGNSCAHDKMILIHEQDELDHWVDVVEEVELAINNYLAQQVS